MDAKAWFARKSSLTLLLGQVRKHQEIIVLAGLLENGSLTWKVADVFAACKKLILTSGAETPDAQLQMDLERLALSAPHVLADIGFERDVGACGPDVDVWHRQDIPFVIQFSTKTSVSTRRSNRTGS